VGGLGLAGLLAAGLWPKPVPVETAPVTQGPLRATVNEEGKTRIRQRFTVSAPLTGQLRRITLDPGDAVSAGETVVAWIEPVLPLLLDARSRTAAEARRDTAAARLDTARRALTWATSERERFEKLFTDQVVSIQEVEAARWRQESAEGEAAAAESALRQAEAELSEVVGGQPASGAAPPPVEVRSPASGAVLRVFEENARVVSAGQPLLELGDPTDLEVVIEVLSRDGATLLPGTPVELVQWGDDRPLRAQVRRVEPAAFTKVSALGVEEQRVRVIADFVDPPEARRGLGDQFRVEARIILWEDPAVLKVPSGALFRRGEQWQVFVVSEGRARLRAVEPGRSSGTETQIRRGIEAGEEVILYPGDGVREGRRVRVITI
jgi:HlyD family secretion protein